MTPPDAGAFLAEITASLKRSFPSYSIEFLLKTPKSLKVNIHLKEGLFMPSDTMPERENGFCVDQ